MIKNILLFISLFNIVNLYALEFSVGAQSHVAMPLVVGVFGKEKSKIEPLVNQLVKDLEFSRQFKVQLAQLDGIVLKKDALKELAKTGAPLAIFVNKVKGHARQFEWRLYDLLDLKMLIGKKVTYKGELNQAAHVIANLVWQQLMGSKGTFNSVIVACKKFKDGDKNRQHIYAFHPTKGMQDKVPLVTSSTINFAPRWHPTKRLLYYSQHTPKNVRLMSISESGKKSIVTDFEGLNLTPAISPSGKIVVSLSSGGCEKLYNYNKYGNKFTALTDCRMHAISPSFIDDDQIVFCAIDSVYKIPRITILNIPNKTATFLTGRAFCVSPAYSSKKNKVAYCKRMKGVQQLFCYDLKTKEHEQLTTSSGDKDECSWSPCGNFIVLTEDRGKSSRIVLWSFANSRLTYLTSKKENWCFPVWSPCYGDSLFAKC
jgi:Tol biopolymer transport system component